MKKQASDQQSHERRYQERKRAEAARKPLKKNAPRPPATPAGSQTAPTNNSGS
jgi:hypothetical protein